MSVLAVVGLQWGDEGKGKVVDYLASSAHLVVRCQGGANAGHTVHVDGRTYVFHLVPSGILHPGTVGCIGNGAVVDPEALVREITELESQGVEVRGRLRVSHAAHLVLPLHRLLDAWYEAAPQGPTLGTTGRGIGPAYADKAGRVGLRVADLLDDRTLAAKLGALLERHRPVLGEHPGEAPGLGELLEGCRAVRDRLAPLVSDVPRLVNDAIDRGESVILEGAQGALLDLDHGTYPYVTSSSTAAGGLGAGCGVGPTRISSVIGVVKVYTTRVGSGPFPTEIEGPEADSLREKGHEFGATTGRPRRCGWFDLVAVRRAALVSHVAELVFTKVDVLGGLSRVRACTAYETRDGLRREYPMEPWLLEDARPVYRDFEGWASGPGGTSSGRLPAPAERYLRFLSSELRIPVRLVSSGAARQSMIAFS
jgi:adenylosuccinate synthase